MGVGEKDNVKTQLQSMNKGKLNGSFKLDLWNPGVQIVAYDKRLASYVQTIGGGKKDKVVATQSLFLIWEVLFDLGLSEPRSWSFVFSLCLALVCWEVRVQVHYIAGFAFLSLVNRPIYSLGIGWYRWGIKYSPVATTTASEIGMLCAGPCAVFVAWLTVAFLLFLVDRLAKVDRITYRVVGLLGVLSALDWPLIMLVDLASLEFFRCAPASDPDPITNRALLKAAAESCTAESYRLWFYFQMNEGNGSIAPVFVVIVYLGLLAVFGVVLYTYFLNVHEEGRILDLYRRLTAKEGAQFLPHDCEVSPGELTEILHKCERWRGRNGGYRKLMVTELHLDYMGEDGEVVGGDKSLTHMAIYTVPRLNGAKGPKQLHRHFLRLQDGALVELIGDEVQFMVSRSVMTAVEKTVSEALGDGGEFIRQSKAAVAAAAQATRTMSSESKKLQSSKGGAAGCHSKNFTSNFNSVVGFGSTKAR